MHQQPCWTLTKTRRSQSTAQTPGRGGVVTNIIIDIDDVSFVEKCDAHVCNQSHAHILVVLGDAQRR